MLLPTDGLRGDLDQFVLWVHGIAVNGLPNAYDQQLSFPPVMAYVWWLLSRSSRHSRPSPTPRIRRSAP